MHDANVGGVRLYHVSSSLRRYFALIKAALPLKICLGLVADSAQNHRSPNGFLPPLPMENLGRAPPGLSSYSPFSILVANKSSDLQSPTPAYCIHCNNAGEGIRQAQARIALNPNNGLLATSSPDVEV